MSQASTEFFDVIVIGGGLHGCSTALHLALRSARVVLLEKDNIGRHASGVNAGGVRRLGRALPEIPLSVESQKIWMHIGDLVDDDCGFVPSSQIKVAETEDELEQLKQRATEVQSLGFTHEEIIDRQDLRKCLPALAEHCVGGMIVRDDGHANPFRTVQAFRRKGASLGVRMVEGLTVNAITRHAGTWTVETDRGPFSAPTVVNCAGAWGAGIAMMMGEGQLPLKAVALMLSITARMPPFVTPVVGAQGRTLSFKQFDNGTVLIGGGARGVANPQTNETQLDFKQLAVNVASAATLFPIMQKACIVRCWAGIEGIIADGLPVIGSGTVPGAWHAFGFSSHGFQLGPISGRIVADLVTDGDTPLPVTPFSITRFSPS